MKNNNTTTAQPVTLTNLSGKTAFTALVTETTDWHDKKVASQRMFFNGTLCCFTAVDKPGYFESPDITYQLWSTYAMLTKEGDGMKGVADYNAEQLVIVTEFGNFLLRAKTPEDKPNLRYGMNFYQGLFVEPLTDEKLAEIRAEFNAEVDAAVALRNQPVPAELDAAIDAIPLPEVTWPVKVVPALMPGLNEIEAFAALHPNAVYSFERDGNKVLGTFGKVEGSGLVRFRDVDTRWSYLVDGDMLPDLVEVVALGAAPEEEILRDVRVCTVMNSHLSDIVTGQLTPDIISMKAGFVKYLVFMHRNTDTWINADQEFDAFLERFPAFKPIAG